MSPLFKILVIFCSLLFAAPSWASDEMDRDGGSTVHKPSRQESLELPGLTACHQCEWRPSSHTMAAGERCGYDNDGKANVAIFECGFAQDCKRVCNFERCLSEVN